MSQGELEEIIDDLGGGGQNATTSDSSGTVTSGSGMNGGNAESNINSLVDTGPSTAAKTKPMAAPEPEKSEPVFDFSSSARDLEDDDDADDDSGMDREIGGHGASEAMYDSATPEPMYDSDRQSKSITDPPTPIPSGDRYNSRYGDSPAKKKKVSKGKKNKKVVKSSKRGKSKVAKKSKSKKRDVASKKKSRKKDRRIASRGR